MTDENVPQVRKTVDRHFRLMTERNKEAWLENMADDLQVEDPVGPSAHNPEGRIYDKQEMANLWDITTGKADSSLPPPRFEIDKFYPCGNEIACVGRSIAWLAGKDGKPVEIINEGVYIYRVNEEGKLDSVRAFFDPSTFEKIDFS